MMRVRASYRQTGGEAAVRTGASQSGRTRPGPWPIVGLLVLALLLGAARGDAETVPLNPIRELLSLSATVSLPDTQLASRLKKYKVSQRLADEEVTEWESLARGPRSLAQLQRIVGESRRLGATPVPPAVLSPGLRGMARKSLPPVATAEAAPALARVKTYALQYTGSIPNFTCVRSTEVRSSDKGMGAWRRERSVDERISVTEGGDRRQTIRSKSHHRVFQRANTLTVSNEFGVLLGRIFGERSHASFEWVGMLPNLRWLLHYAVPEAHSSLTITVKGRQEITGYDGYLEVDPASGAIYEVSYRSNSLPEDFDISGGEGTVRYGDVEIEGKTYLLPVSASMITCSGGVFIDNRAVYSAYRKFEASSEIRFDTAHEGAELAPPQ